MPMRTASARLANLLPYASLLTVTSLVTVVAHAAVPSGAPRSCLTSSARALLTRIEQRFGPVQVVSTCRPGATIAGTGRPSRHASGNAVDFTAGNRKQQIVTWLIANHRSGGTMTYPGLDHIHVDIGRHFVALASGSRSANASRPLLRSRMALGAGTVQPSGN